MEIKQNFKTPTKNEHKSQLLLDKICRSKSSPEVQMTWNRNIPSVTQQRNPCHSQEILCPEKCLRQKVLGAERGRKFVSPRYDLNFS